NPLDEEAMHGIAQRACAKLADLWLRKREKRIEIASEVIATLGREAHRHNEQTHGSEGGRIVRKLVRDHVESRLQTAASDDRDAYRTAARILVTLSKRGDEISSLEQIQVSWIGSGHAVGSSSSL